MRILKTIKKYIPAIVLVVIFVLLQWFNTLYEIEMTFEDRLYQKPSYVPNDIKIIAIDEESLSKLGPYSDWDRSYFAELIGMLSKEENRPAVIGVDIMFTGSKSTESDELLAEMCKEAGNVIMATKLNFSSEVTHYGDKYYLYEYVSSETKPYDELAAVTDWGFTNALFDKDGYVRSSYTVYASNGNVYESFPYKIASTYAGEDFDVTKPAFRFRFTGKPGEFEWISMSRILNGDVPASYFKDSIVLIGAYEEGLMDAYSVPNNRKTKMYGVELHANIINALLNDMEVFTMSNVVMALILAIFIFGYYILFINKGTKLSIFGFAAEIIIYYVMAICIYNVTSYEMTLVYMPITLLCTFITMFVVKYVQLQKRRAKDMQRTLFSMADSMAEAIEGRTPYNASHTKNVANRCKQMLEYINELHKSGKTKLHFSQNDITQLYLAAMLHDIGKMDIPLEIMDKPSKLGFREEKLRDRLLIIKLKLELDAHKSRITKEEAEGKIQTIDAFVSKLGLFNCGKPLNDEEKAMIANVGSLVYTEEDGTEIPYLTQEELDDLNIKAGTLSDEERKIMQDHVVRTDKILEHVYFGEGFERVRELASNHHELLNGRGYPNGLGADKLDAMTRILTIMDIYDSLIADDRPYKKAKPIPVAFEILDEEAEAGKIDKDLLAIAKELWLVEETTA